VAPQIEEPAASQRRGRPRSPVAEQAILTATLDLMAEGQGPATISMGAIARRAGAGKDTIYRRWTCKEDLLLDALASQVQPIEIPPEATIREALVVALAELIGRMQNERDRRILRSLNGAGEDFPKLRDRFHQEVVARRRERVRALVRAATARGELRSESRPEEIATMPFAAVVMAALEDNPIRGDPRRAAERMIDAVLQGIAAK
jgi:AcrR family transcriptional regulator